MFHIKVQASEPSGSEAGDFFKIFFMGFYQSNLGPPGAKPFGPGELGLNKLGKGPLGNATYQISII